MKKQETALQTQPPHTEFFGLQNARKHELGAPNQLRAPANVETDISREVRAVGWTIVPGADQHQRIYWLRAPGIFFLQDDPVRFAVEAKEEAQTVAL